MSSPFRASLERVLRAGLVLASIFLLGACESPKLEALPADAVLLAFGNSLTFGTGARPPQSYPAVLAELTGREVVNAGVPGEVSKSGLKRLPRLVERHEPDLVIICHGGNDMLRKLGEAQLEQNLRSMVTLLRERGVQVVMLGVPDPGLFLSSADLFERVAEDLDVPLENDVVPDLLGDNQFKSDQIHPNAKGYQRMAEAVNQLLIDAGAL